MASTFQAGGLSSGLDTNTLIDKLVQTRSVPLTNLQKLQAGLQTQISTVGTIASKIADLDAAARSLSTGGVLASKSTSTNSSFSATPGSGTVPGTYSVQVLTLAQAAKSRSQGFAAGEVVQGGTLALTVQGQSFTVEVADGSTLEDTVAAIRASGAPVSAVVLDDGTNRYLSISSTASGFPTTGVPGDALSIVETSTGSSGKPLTAAPTQVAQNATLTVDGLLFTRQSNLVAGAIPGATLSLVSQGGPAETLSLSSDASATSAKLKSFIDAYNAVIGLVQGQLAVSPSTDRNATLAGDLSIRTLQSQIQALTSATVTGLGNVRTLADLGVKTNRDGSLTIDDSVLATAIARDPAAVNEMFSTASTGIGALTSTLATNYTRPTDGILTTRSTSLASKATDMAQQATRLQAQLDAYRSLLVAQFTAMETLIGNLKNSGTYLNSIGSGMPTSSK
jgi:flagellar hook-associated protein 2